MRYKASRAVPHDADKSLHNSGTRGSSGFCPENTTHYPDRTRLERRWEGSKGKARPATSIPVRGGPTGIRPPVAWSKSSQFPSWDVLHRDSWGRCKEWTSSPGAGKSNAWDIRRLERTGGPLAHSASTRVHHFLAQKPLPATDPCLCEWPTSDSLEMFRPSSSDSCGQLAFTHPLEVNFGSIPAGLSSPFWEQPPRCPLGNLQQGTTPPSRPR